MNEVRLGKTTRPAGLPEISGRKVNLSKDMLLVKKSKLHDIPEMPK